MAMRRSQQMLLIGTAVFVIGAGIVLVSMRGSGGSAAAKTPATTPTTIQNGTVVVPSGTVAPPATFTIPDGEQAVALQFPYLAGLAGYARAGDRVDVYADISKGTAANVAPPQTKLILANVPVLAVSGPGPGAQTGNVTYLLGLDAGQAEQAIFFSNFEALWLTLAPKNQAPPTTPGRSYKNAF